MVTALETVEAAHGVAAGSLRFEIQVETPQAILGADGTALVAADDPRRRPAGDGPALRDLRLLRVAGRRRGVPEHGAPGRRPRQGRHAGRRGRHRGLRLATARPTCCRSGTATPCAPRGSSTSGWCAARSPAASTRAGTCTRPSCRAGSWRRTPSTAKAWPRPRHGSGPTCDGGRVRLPRRAGDCRRPRRVRAAGAGVRRRGRGGDRRADRRRSGSPRAPRPAIRARLSRGSSAWRRPRRFTPSPWRETFVRCNSSMPRNRAVR